ncbi:MAG: efflux RND transporter periplasmic adaptor subunit [Bacteroidia bacterium]
MKTMKTYYITGIMGAILIACQNNNSENNTPQSNAENIVTLSHQELQNINIQTDTLHIKEVNYIIHSKGYIDVPPQNIYALSVPLGGYLKYTHLLPGTPIKKGEVIAIIEDPQYIQLQEDYLNTKVLLATLEKNYLRQKELAEQKAVSEKSYEQSLAEYENTKIKLKALEEKLSLIGIQPSQLTADKISKSINITAPFNGYVTKINYSVGKYIPASEVLFELVNPNDIHLNIKVFENDLQYIKIGQKVIAFTNAEQQKKHECKIILINKIVNPDRTVDVHCHFNQYDESLIPGTFMQADIYVENKQAYTIPKNALVFYNNQYYVFVQKNNLQFEMINVELNQFENDNEVEVNNYQVLAGKKIVIQNPQVLLMKLKNNEEE